MKKQTNYIFAILFVLPVLITLLAVEGQAAARMPSFALKNVNNGEIIDSESFKGKVLLLTFFATWCPPCVEEVPILVDLHKRLADSGFSVIGLSVDQGGAAVVEKFVEKRKINYPVLQAKPQTAMDFGGVFGIPVAFLVNKSGNVVKKYTGYVGHTILEKDIRSLLN